METYPQELAPLLIGVEGVVKHVLFRLTFLV